MSFYISKERFCCLTAFQTGKKERTVLCVNKQRFTALYDGSFQDKSLLTLERKKPGDTDALLQRRFNAFTPGSDQDKVHAKVICDRSAYHITEDHFTSVFFQ